jgi:PrcB C-terminal
MIRQMRRLVPALIAVLTACKAPAGITPVTEIPAGAVNIDWNDAGAVRLAHAYYSGLRQSARTVIDNDADWRTIWSMYTGNQGTPPAAPTIDFARYEVIVAALGERNTGGYDMRISRIAATNDYLYVELTSLRPGPRCLTTQALTQPVDIVRIPRQHPPVMFIEKSRESSC